MSGRTPALIVCALGVAAVAAQYLWPRWESFHSWEYAAALFIGVLLLGSAAWGALRTDRSRRGSGLATACLGAVLAIVAGLASGLLGPDTQTYVRAPGTVLPLVDAGIAAGFPIADADEITRGVATIDLRHRDHTVQSLAAGSRAFSGSFEMESDREPAAFIRATDRAGRHMTVTQPSGSAFLSPVLLFPARVRIGANDLSADSFTIPALARTFKAIYFPAKTLALTRGHAAVAGKDALLFIVDDAGGRLVNGGIGLAPGGGHIALADVDLYPALGTYPQLVVSSVPFPAAFGLGLLLFVIGAVLTTAGAQQAAAPARNLRTPVELH